MLKKYYPLTFNKHDTAALLLLEQLFRWYLESSLTCVLSQSPTLTQFKSSLSETVLFENYKLDANTLFLNLKNYKDN